MRGTQVVHLDQERVFLGALLFASCCWGLMGVKIRLRPCAVRVFARAEMLLM